MVVPSTPERTEAGINFFNILADGMMRPTVSGIAGAVLEGSVRNISAIPNRPIKIAT